MSRPMIPLLGLTLVVGCTPVQAQAPAPPAAPSAAPGAPAAPGPPAAPGAPAPGAPASGAPAASPGNPGKPATPEPARTTNPAPAPIDYIALYAGAFRFYRPVLDTKTSSFLAERVLADGREQGVDARLTISVLARTRALERVRSEPRGVFVGSETAREYLLRVARELGSRFRRQSETETNRLAVVRQAVSDYLRVTSPKTEHGEAKLSGLVKDVLHYYVAMLTEPEKKMVERAGR